MKRVSRTMTSDSGHVGFFHRPAWLGPTPKFLFLFYFTLLFISTCVLKVFSGWRFDQEI